MKRILGLAVGLVLALAPGAAGAANLQITGGSNGTLCSSGGYFTPSSATATVGDTVTISVPANDPYSAGLDVHGFPEGTFTILPGHSHTTAALTGNVSYYGTWPSSGCLKGSGTITVHAASTPTPAATHTPTPAPVSGGSKTPTPSPSKTPATSASPSPSTSASPTASPQSTASPAASPESSASPSVKPVAQHNGGMSGPTLVMAARVGGTVIFLVLGALAIRFWLNRRLYQPQVAGGPAAVTPPAVKPTTFTPHAVNNQNDQTNQNNQSGGSV